MEKIITKHRIYKSMQTDTASTYFARINILLLITQAFHQNNKETLTLIEIYSLKKNVMDLGRKNISVVEKCFADVINQKCFAMKKN